VADITVLLEHGGPCEEELHSLTRDIIGDSVEIVVTDPGLMRVLNRRYRHIDRSTDVLSFDLAASEGERPEGTIYVDGRLYPPMSELLERIFHGYLHLCGYTHDTDEESEAMVREAGRMVKLAMERAS
jgi:probable rRNA maturation factor